MILNSTLYLCTDRATHISGRSDMALSLRQNGKGGNPKDPEIAAIHKAINAWYAAGKKVDMFITMHTASDLNFINCISIEESSQALRNKQKSLFGLIINSADFRYVQEFRISPVDAAKELYDEYGTNGILIKFAKYKSPFDRIIALWEQ